MGDLTTTGLVSLVAGEDWHYVDATDEPAFQNSWANVGGGNPQCAFRFREAGVVDVHGTVTGGADTEVIFTLPDGYRPSWLTAVFGIGNDGSGLVPIVLSIQTDGDVVFGGAGTLASFAGQFFLDPPDVA